MGNTVGSRGVLTQRQKEILIGTVLGDAYLEKNGRYTRVRIDHYDKHKTYIFWLAQEFLPFSLKPRHIVETDKRNGKQYSRWHFSTKSLPIFDEFRELFYRNGKKIISPLLVKILSPLSLAIWYMDDGSNNGRNITLNTHNFSISEQKVLQKFLLNKFGVATTLVKDRSKYKIAVGSYEYSKFIKIVRPFVIPSMSYKISSPRNDLIISNDRVMTF